MKKSLLRTVVTTCANVEGAVIAVKDLEHYHNKDNEQLYCIHVTLRKENLSAIYI